MDLWNILSGQLQSKHCVTTSLSILLEHILNTDPDEMWQEKYNQSVELFSRICKALENKIVSLKHPHTSIKCKYDYN